MKINTLVLKNFRNYSQQNFEFDGGINLLSGKNAQGKTNAAEAIFFLCTGYSPRANKDNIVIKNGEASAEIYGIATSLYGEVSVKIIFNRNDKKEVYVNGLKITRIGELFGNIHSVFFNPSELKLVQESPEDRRRFMNISLSQMSKAYFYALQRYNKILLQRNNLLKNPDWCTVKETLSVWDAQLSKEAAEIIFSRNKFLEELAPLAQQKHALLSSDKEVLKIKTESNYGGTKEEISAALLKDLNHSLEKDIRLGFTTIGPHRDDIKFTLNETDAKIYGSQGQQRTIALSLKLAETEAFYLRFGEYPVLILDDVLSELDKTRQRKLIGAVENLQTVFTATGIDRTVFKGREIKKFAIENGKIK